MLAERMKKVSTSPTMKVAGEAAKNCPLGTGFVAWGPEAHRERARALKARSNGANEEQMKLAGPKPEVRAGGVVPIMMESLQAGKLTELKANNITAWGALDFEEVDGTVYWTGTVQCTVDNALFGPQPTEVMALIKDNKIIKWIYTGSREEVQ